MFLEFDSCMIQYCVIDLLSPLPTGEPYCSVQFYIVLVTWDFHKFTLKVRHHQLLHFSHLFSYSLKLLTVEKMVKVIGALGVGGDFGVILLFSCLVIAQARKHIAMRIGANRCHDNKCWVSCGSEVSDQTIDSKCWEVCNSMKGVEVMNLQRVITKNLQLQFTFIASCRTFVYSHWSRCVVFQLNITLLAHHEAVDRHSLWL